MRSSQRIEIDKAYIHVQLSIAFEREPCLLFSCVDRVKNGIPWDREPARFPLSNKVTSEAKNRAKIACTLCGQRND